MTIQTYQRDTFTKLVSNCGTVAGRKKCKSTSGKTNFRNEKETWTFNISDKLLHNREKMLTSVNLTVVIHGMTRSKNLIDILHRCVICISYNDLLLFYVIWALRDAETSKTCPRGIAYVKPPIVKVDNDDFKTDILTGNASGAHQVYVLYVQPESYKEESNNSSTTAQNVTER